MLVILLRFIPSLFPSSCRTKSHGRRKICKPSQKHAHESPIPSGLVHGPSEQQVTSRRAPCRCLSGRVHTRHSATEEEGSSFSSAVLRSLHPPGNPAPLQIPTARLPPLPGGHPGESSARLARQKLLQVTSLIAGVK